MDAATADAINRRDAELMASFLDDLDQRLPDRRAPWYLGPIGHAFTDDMNDPGTNSYRAWLFGKHAWRIPDLRFDGAPADCDWDGLFAHFRALIEARRDPESPHAAAGTTRCGAVV